MTDGNLERLESLGREVDKLRDKSHTLSNMATDHEGRISTLEKEMEENADMILSMDREVHTLERSLHVLEKNLVQLTTQNETFRQMFKWIGGGVATIVVTLILEFLPNFERVVK